MIQNQTYQSTALPDLKICKTMSLIKLYKRMGKVLTYCIAGPDQVLPSRIFSNENIKHSEKRMNIKLNRKDTLNGKSQMSVWPSEPNAISRTSIQKYKLNDFMI